MSLYYPQAAVQLRLLLEDHKTKDATLAKTYDLLTLAKTVTVSINDYRQADTFKITLDYKCFPFDPRAIRALGVSIYLENMKALYDKDGEGLTIQVSEKNVVFQGFADEDSIDFNDQDRTVSFEGRDFTGLFLDSPYPYGTLEVGKPIDVVLGQIIKQCRGAEKIQVENRVFGADGKPTVLPTLTKFFPDFGNGGQLTGRKNVSRHQTFWDVMQDIIERAGLIGYIEIDRLVLTKPRNLYAGAQPYQFIYGRNLKTLKMSRKLSKQKGFNIVMRSFFPESLEVLTAEIPKESTEEWAAAIGIKREPVTIKRPVAPNTGQNGANFDEVAAPTYAFNVPNVRNKAQLIELGQTVFEELSRQQIEGTLETKEMNILQRKIPTTSDFTEFDVTKIRAGTPVLVGAPSDELEQAKEMTPEKRESYLRARGYSPDIAHALAVTLRRFPLTFYTKAVEFTVDKENGFSMKLDFVNFIDLKQKGL